MAVISKINAVEKTNISSFTDVSAANIANVDGVLFYPPAGTRGVFGGSYLPTNVIEYITIASTGNSTNFGDLTVAREQLAATSNNATGRGVFGGGDTGSNSDVIDYITILSTGDADDFGDLTAARLSLSATSNGTNDRGVFIAGNSASDDNIIDYITISSAGNATNFGDITYGNLTDPAATSNATNDRGVIGGGWSGGRINTISYITISTTGNSTNFGDLAEIKHLVRACSNAEKDRGIFAGGGIDTGVLSDTIEYITISTTGNADDFGNLLGDVYDGASCSSGIGNRGIYAGGANAIVNVIQYVTISSLGNATNFGDLLSTKYQLAGTNN